METLFALIFWAIVWIACKAYHNYKVDHYDLNKVSVGKMAMDAGKSPSVVQRNMLAGKYDKDFPEQY